MSENQNAQKKVLALKYRPRRFEDLVGQSTISQTLSLALDSNRLSHAYLFSGLRGSGKTSTARIMAKALLCSSGPTSKPCETCENCVSANTNRHLDIIEMDAASNRGIDDIKDLIEHTKYKPSSARFKVFIIDEVHMLTTPAFNALLKTLEEPPGFVKFILATTDPLKLPATILSRTQHFRFNKIAPSDVLHHLSHILNEENIDFETAALEILTRSGQGSLRDTLTLLDQAIIFSKGKVTVPAVVDMLGLIEPALMDKLFEVILKKGDITNLVKELENYEISQVFDEMSIYLKQKMLDKDAKFDLLLFDRFFRILGDAKHLLALNSDSGFVLILTLSKMIEATNLKTIEEIINQVEQVEVKPVIKEAIAPQKVVEHSQNDVNHAYDDKLVQLNEQYHQNKKEQNESEVVSVEPVQEAVVEKTTLEESKIKKPVTPEPVVQEVKEEPVEQTPIKEQATPSAKEEKVSNFATPFDEFPVTSDVKQNSVEEQVSKEEKVQDSVQETQPVQTIQEETSTEESSSEEYSEYDDIVYEPIVEKHDDTPMDKNALLYEDLTQKVYERDYDLGEAFEKNFIYKSFENNKLQIISHAQGEERKFLFKYFGVIKTFIYDIFGSDIELDFLKEDSSTTSRVR